MIGQSISHYKILEKLGAGGMGEVYRAQDTILGREVAIKVLPEAVAADAERLARFEREAKAVARLSHPNILEIYELGEHEEQPFMVTEVLEGETLRERLEGGSLGWRKAAEIGAAIADGLAAVHQLGIVHRDLKPSNVFLTSDGRVKVLDFGLARHGDLETGEYETHAPTLTRQTDPGTVLGTVGYMSPEQVAGAETDHRSDIFSLGCVLYEIASRRRAFARDTAAETMTAILKEEPAEISSTDAALPSELERTIRRCLEKRPESRFQSASDLAYNLRSIAGGTDAVRPGPTSVAPRRGRKWPWAAAAAALIMGTAAVVLNLTGLRNRLAGTASPPPIQSLAVLPLANLSGDPEQEYFVDGMTEALIADLAQIEALRVISRTSTMRYKNTDKPLPQIARELNVDGIVEGSVLRAKDRVRITAQLIHASTDRHIWAKSYERDLEDVLSLQKEVARAVATEIRARVTEPERDRLLEAGRLHPEAYESYLKGRWFSNQWNEEALRKAIGLFDRAIELDAGFAPGYAGLADAYVILSFYSQTDPKEVMPKAKAAALKAVELDDSLAEAHSSLGLVLTNYDFDWEGAEIAYRRAIELNPGSMTAHTMYMWYLVGMTRFDEALAEIRKAHEASPLDVYVIRAEGDALLFARRYDEAIVAVRRAIEMDPEFTYAHFSLGRAYLRKALYEEALAEFEEELRVSRSSDPVVTSWMGLAHAAMGRKEEAYDILTDLTQRSEREYVPASLLASLHFALDQVDDGFAWLDAAYRGRDGWLASMKADPRYDRVREDPRFQAFLKKMGLP